MSAFLKQLDFSVITDALLNVIPAVICITLHELSHGVAALRLGDPTAKNAGRLTLNPLKHIDLFGLICLAVFGFGWAKPVPVDMRNFKNPRRGMGLTALAGPAANMAVAVVFLALWGFFTPALYGSKAGTVVLGILRSTAVLSIGLAIFNVLPIPPLDGSKVAFSIVSERLYRKLMRYERYGMILLILLLAAGVLSAPMNRGVTFIWDRLVVVAETTFEWGKAVWLNT
ncbi:MAG: site-2 protease family protein [Oscillospiraceae bacterium]|nr:site-2 protease family protein [Oscillospiraceae bacterium]